MLIDIYKFNHKSIKLFYLVFNLTNSYIHSSFILISPVCGSIEILFSWQKYAAGINFITQCNGISNVGTSGISF